MRFAWKGKWKGGEITIEAETIQELEAKMKELSLWESQSDSKTQALPRIPTAEGCSDAIRALMMTDWGRRPRSMGDIKDALETNGLHFSKGTLSGTLTTMTKRGDIRRIKESGKWKYFLRVY